MKKSKYIRELTKIIILFILLISFQQLTLSNSLNNFKYIGPTIYNHSNANLTKLKDGKILISSSNILPVDLSNPIPEWKRYIQAYELYNPKTNNFENITQPKIWLRGNHIVLDDGRVLFAEGYCPQPSNKMAITDFELKMCEISKYAYIYDPKTDTFKVSGKMLVPRSQYGLTKLKNGQLLLTNGLVQLPGKYDNVGLENIKYRLEREQNSKYAEKFDPTTEKFKFAGESVINIIKKGGVNKDITYRLSDTSEQAITLNNGEVLILWLYEGTAEIYNPNTGQFRQTGNLLKKRNSSYPAPTVQKLPDGRVIIISGSSKEAYNSAEIFDPKTEKFYDLGNLAVNRPYTSASLHSVLLNDGKILIWGGTIRDQSIFKNHKSIKSMEVFDPKTNSFEYLGEIPDKYNFYNAIALDNGAVFFIGVSKFLGKSNTYGVIYKERNL